MAGGATGSTVGPRTGLLGDSGAVGTGGVLAAGVGGSGSALGVRSGGSSGDGTSALVAGGGCGAAGAWAWIKAIKVRMTCCVSGVVVTTRLSPSARVSSTDAATWSRRNDAVASAWPAGSL